MARFYADDDFPFPVVERLRQLGHDVLTGIIEHVPELVPNWSTRKVFSPSRSSTVMEFFPASTALA